MSVNPSTAKLYAAVGEFSGQRSDINKATLGVITEKFVGLMSARWAHICDAAHDEENNGKLALNISIAIDLSAKAPVGSINLKFTPSKVNDGVGFKVGDPDQETLPLTDGGANPPPARRRGGRRPRATVRETTPADTTA